MSESSLARRLVRRCARLLAAPLHCRKGSSIALIAIAIVPLVGAMGLAIDTARGYMVKARLNQALDAAALAGGRVMFDPSLDDTVNAMFRANFPDGFLGATITGPNLSVDAGGETLTVSASADVNTSLMAVLGFDVMQVRAQSEVRRRVAGMELVLVMDVTGSMRSGGRINTMKAAATDLVNILYGDSETIDDFWVGVVPYAVMVNIGASRVTWVTGYDPSDYIPTAWKGCVEARAAPLDQDDTPPSGGLWTPAFYPSDSDNVWPSVREENGWQNDGTGPNLGCGPEITPLVAEKSTVLGAIDEMLPWHRGGTMGNLGLAWGWRMLSPRWRGLWGGDTPMDLPLDYDTPLMNKVVVMLTDGNNEWYDHPPSGPDGSDYGAYGRLGWGRLGTTNHGAALTEVNTRMANTCQMMKDNGIILYTITFQQNNAATQELYRTCATSPGHYFDSPTNADLTQAFRTIGTELSNLRISQ